MTVTSLAPQVWPVIHLTSPERAIENAQMAVDAGCEGVFVIQMEGDDQRIDPMVITLRKLFPRLKIGVNYLSLGALDALERSLNLGCDATWTDNPGVRSDLITDEAYRLSERLAGRKAHLFFGSVAFKYQKKDADPGQAALRAKSLGMIPTTSGPGTGYAPDVSKLRLMRQAVHGGDLAVASGISPDNVAALGPHVSHILVATGISVEFDRFDPALLGQIMINVKNLAS